MNYWFQLSAEKTRYTRIYIILYTKKRGGGIICKGCEISEDVFFGSEPYLIRIGNVVAGIPARIIETTEQYYQKKKDKVLPTNNLSRAEKREYLEKIYDSF